MLQDYRKPRNYGRKATLDVSAGAKQKEQKDQLEEKH